MNTSYAERHADKYLDALASVQRALKDEGHTIDAEIVGRARVAMRRAIRGLEAARRAGSGFDGHTTLDTLNQVQFQVIHALNELAKLMEFDTHEPIEYL